jgi:protein-S-isoprenylcysteine O-methyltransferase Ste14
MTLRVLALAAFLLVPAGTWRWPEGWIMVALFSVWAVFMGTYLIRHDPALLEERLALSLAQEGQKSWDKVFMIAALVVGLALLILPGLDAVRYRWTHIRWPFEALGFVGMIPCLALVFLVLRENTYLLRVVKIDRERGHHVITTGPYAYVRHPMYAAVIVMLVCMPVALGSLLSLIPAALLDILIVIRTHLEDRTLHDELPGYPEYAQITRYRLVPGLW